MSLQVWLPLNGDLHNQGVLNITGTNYNSTVNSAGKIGSCYYFNGSNMRIEYPHDKTIWNDKEISICMWYKWATGGNESGQCVIDIAADLCLSYKHSSSGVQFGYWRAYSNNGTRTGNGDYASTYYTDTTWHHVVLICDHNFNHIYVDGVLSQTFDKSNNYTANWKPLLAASYNKITIGKSAGSNPYASGYVNDVRIYDHALSAAEVREISQGLVLHYKLDGMDAPNVNLGGTSADYNNKTEGQVVAASAWGGDAGSITFYHSGGYAGLPYKEYHKTATGSGGIYTKTANDINLEANTTYTMSCWIKGSRAFNASQHTFNINRGSDNLYITYGTTIPITTDWQFFSKTFTTTDTQNGAYGEMSIVYDDGATDYYVYYSGFKIEKGSTATRWTPPGIQYTTIQDSSGYNHNGAINGSIIISSDTNRYNYSTQFDGVDDSITVPYNTICPENIFTFNLWFKKDALGSKNYETLFGGPSGFEMDTRAGSATTLSLYMASTRSGNRNAVTSMSLGNWYMITMVRDGTKERYYVNGIFQSEIDAKSMPTGTYRIGAWNSNTGQNYYGLISDFRIYATALSAADILELYHTGAKIDNKANFHTYEINENGTNKLTKTGIMYDNMEESIMTLPDGSHWQLLMFHYVDDGKNLFTSSNANNCNDFGLFSRLKDIDGFKLNNQYEFYAIQDDTAYRWIQTNAPLTTTSVTGFSAVSGYNSPGAGICKCAGNTLLARTNSTGNWWNAMGCYTIYNNGIPGFNSVVCKKYMALYARIEKADVKLANQTTNTSEFIEL